jgi:hypothetical protein
MRDLSPTIAMTLVLVAGALVGTTHAQQDATAAEFYVATDGDDGWSGTLASPKADGSDGPFATIQRARDAVRKAKAAKPAPYTILVRGGVYRLREPIVFTPEDSGTVKGVITYAAYPGERPVLSGGRAIGGWTKGEGKIWRAQIPEVKAGEWYFHQLFVNGQRRTRARTPNEGYLRTAGPRPEIKNPRAERENPAAKIGFLFKPGDFALPEDPDDVNFFVYHSWTASLHWVSSLGGHEQLGLVGFTAPSNWPIGWWEREQRYYVENYRAALDAPGEWYLDRKTGVLHYWPLPGEDLSAVVVEAPVLRKLVRFAGDYEKQQFVEHIRLRGLSFQHADWFVKDKGPADGQAAAWLEAAVFAQGARYCTIEACEVAHVGEYGFYFERGCQHNLIQKCHVHDLGAGGVRLGHMSSPRDHHEASERNVVDNCIIHDGGCVFRAGVGVWIGRSSYNKISHNVIRDFDYTGISVGWSWGYAPTTAHDNVIEYNHVANIGRGVLSDMGGIYTLGVSPGTVIRSNIFHGIESYAYGGWGLYTDEGSSGIVMENNIVYDTKTGGFHQHYGRDNVVRNNILAFSKEGQLQRTRQEPHKSFTFERNIVYFDNGQLFSGNWGDGQFEMDHNVYWNAGGSDVTFTGMSLAEWQATGFDQHSLIADPLFIDAANRDFRLKPDSPALELGFQPIDRSEIGLYGDEAWTSLGRTLGE